MPEGDTFVLHAVGDVHPSRFEYGEALEAGYVHVAERLRAADVVMAQLECNLSTKGAMQWRNQQTTWYGRSDPRNVGSLSYAGFNLLSHASNHCFDYGPEALVETIEVLNGAGIQVIGVGRDLDEARRPAVFEAAGSRVAFLDYCAVLPEEYEARENKPGCAPLRVKTYYEAQEYQPGTPPRIITIAREADVQMIEGDIRAARDHADVVVLCVHWGIHFVPGMLADYETAVGRRAIDAGADLVLGTHAHIPKAIQFYKGKAIFHNLGNFCQETPHHLAPPPGAFSSHNRPHYGMFGFRLGEREITQLEKTYTMMVRCEITRGAITRLSFVPGRVEKNTVPRFGGPGEPEFAEVVEYLRQDSARFGTRFEPDGDDVVVSPSTEVA
jgi:Bacterial capsule synthesis protein PGA_cap